MTQSVDFVRDNTTRKYVCAETINASDVLKSDTVLNEVRLSLWQRLNCLAIALIQGFISNFYSQPLRSEYATISQEAWWQFLYGNRFEFVPKASQTAPICTQEDLKFADFQRKFLTGVVLREKGGEDVAVRTHGIHITPMLLGFVVRHLQAANIEEPTRSDISPCLVGSVSNLRLLADHILSWEVRKTDTAHSLFYRIAQRLNELTSAPGIRDTEAYTY